MDDDGQPCDLTEDSSEPPVPVVGLSALPLDVVERLSLHLAVGQPRDRRGVKGLASLSATCRALRDHVTASDCAWDSLAERYYAFDAPASLDVRVGFPFAFSSANAGAERATDEIIASSLAWALAQCRSHERAAYSRPTVGALAEAPSLGGGASGFWALERGQRQLSERLHVIECDIAQLPMHVDMLVVPSNEWLRNPGWGAMDALYRLGGAELAEWVYAQQGTAHAHGGPPSSAVLSSGQVRTSLAYGAINASYLCHAVGISFYDAVDYMQVVTHQLQQALAQLRAAALQQIALLQSILREAATHGATSVALPAVSAGKRGFPPVLAAAITFAVCASEVLASGGTLDVHVVAFGDENHRTAFEGARAHALNMLVPRAAGAREAAE